MKKISLLIIISLIYGKRFEGILQGTCLHDNIIRLAAHFAFLGIPRKDTEAILQAGMDSSLARVCEYDRWKARCDEIPPAVESAFTKFWK